MQQLSYTLRSKPSWWTKYQDPEIRDKWKTEAMEQTIMGVKLSEAEVTYVLDELAGYEEMRDDENGIQVRQFSFLRLDPKLMCTPSNHALLGSTNPTSLYLRIFARSSSPR